MPRTLTVVGVGALGSHLVQFLRNEDVLVRIIDFDRVEQRNLHSQFHGKPSVGKKKVEALKQSMLFLFGQRVQTIPHKLGAENAEELLRSDLVVDCLDNADSRRILQESVRSTRTPCLHGALAKDGSFARVIWDEISSSTRNSDRDRRPAKAASFFPLSPSHQRTSLARHKSSFKQMRNEASPFHCPGLSKFRLDFLAQPDNNRLIAAANH